jgi:hypothetical protein
MSTTTTVPPIPTVNWTGASGTTYTFHIHPNPTNFSPNQDGNYIYAKVVNNAWVPIYIGEGDLSARCSDQHHKAACIASKGATHIHERVNPDEATRQARESDLLAAYPQAYAPIGCNVKIGG